jgi:hypothetical protein
VCASLIQLNGDATSTIPLPPASSMSSSSSTGMWNGAMKRNILNLLFMLNDLATHINRMINLLHSLFLFSQLSIALSVFCRLLVSSGRSLDTLGALFAGSVYSILSQDTRTAKYLGQSEVCKMIEEIRASSSQLARCVFAFLFISSLMDLD